MYRDQFPGLDGVTIEVLIKGWEFMGPVCFAMVKVVWGDGNMTTKALAGVLVNCLSNV